MNKSKMDKFLEFSFKVGKVLSSIFLIIIFGVVIFCGIRLTKFNFNNVSIPKFDVIEQEMENNDSDEEEDYSQNENQYGNQDSEKYQYSNKIENIIEEYSLDSKIKSKIESNVFSLPEQYRNLYLDGLNRFYFDAFQYLTSNSDAMQRYLYYGVKKDVGYYYADREYNKIVNVKANGVYNIHLCNAILYDYTSLFRNNLGEIEAKAQEEAAAKNLVLIILGCSILVFVILLFLPILIKIEENTRPVYKTIEEEEIDGEKKECSNCHKMIMKSAKKCRFCGTWLEEQN